MALTCTISTGARRPGRVPPSFMFPPPINRVFNVPAKSLKNEWEFYADRPFAYGLLNLKMAFTLRKRGPEHGNCWTAFFILTNIAFALRKDCHENCSGAATLCACAKCNEFESLNWFYCLTWTQRRLAPSLPAGTQLSQIGS